MRKKILVVGGGGREHAICWAITQSQRKYDIFCAPGNAGIAKIATCIDIASIDIKSLIKFVEENKIDLTIVGGEVSLALGIVDEFEQHKLKIFGPTLAASRLESSKVFAKEFMMRHGIPTAAFTTASSADQAISILNKGDFGDENTPVVVKADGLAGGKGVIVSENRDRAIVAINELTHGGLIDTKATEQIILEKMLKGREVSMLLFSDGNNFALMPPARDYKRVGDNNRGANTGGMGTISDDSLLNNSQTNEIISTIIEPTLNGCKKEGFPFCGVLFLGVMLTDKGPQVIEYNVRFGDPETQSILLRLESDLVEICESIIERRLDQNKIHFSSQSSCCVILATSGYPAKPIIGNEIRGLESQIDKVTIFHSGTRQSKHGSLHTNGGRVLGVSATGRTVEAALKRAYKSIKQISWDGMHYRSDIGT